eukprot:SAG31_NODE_2139_length_6349_cov_2.773636_7_plen_98_part_00
MIPTRSNYKEVEPYLEQVCDDMDGWVKPDVVDWCRSTMGDESSKIMISGLVQMFPGNLVESICSMGAKVCPPEEKGVEFVAGEAVRPPCHCKLICGA